MIFNNYKKVLKSIILKIQYKGERQYNLYISINIILNNEG